MCAPFPSPPCSSSSWHSPCIFSNVIIPSLFQITHTFALWVKRWWTIQRRKIERRSIYSMGRVLRTHSVRFFRQSPSSWCSYTKQQQVFVWKLISLLYHFTRVICPEASTQFILFLKNILLCRLYCVFTGAVITQIMEEKYNNNSYTFSQTVEAKTDCILFLWNTCSC